MYVIVYASSKGHIRHYTPFNYIRCIYAHTCVYAYVRIYTPALDIIHPTQCAISQTVTDASLNMCADNNISLAGLAPNSSNKTTLLDLGINQSGIRASFLAEISVSSPRKLFIFII